MQGLPTLSADEPVRAMAMSDISIARSRLCEEIEGDWPSLWVDGPARRDF